MKNDPNVIAKIIIVTVCKHYGIEPQRLKGLEKIRLITEPRMICAFLNLLFDGEIKHIVSDLGYKLHNSVYQARWRLLAKIKKEEEVGKKTRIKNDVLSLVTKVGRELNHKRSVLPVSSPMVHHNIEVVNMIEVDQVVSTRDQFDRLINAVWSVCCPAHSVTSFCVSEMAFYARQLSIFLAWSWLKHDMDTMTEEFNADQEYIQRAIGIVEYNLNNGQIHKEEILLEKIKQKLLL